MRKSAAALIALALLLAAPSPSLAGGSLWNEAADTAPADIPALCARMIANQDKNRTGMIDAAHLYSGGMLMGQHCVKKDYVRALNLLRKAGDRLGFQHMRQLLEKRAKGNSGGAKAAARALKQADLSWF